MDVTVVAMLVAVAAFLLKVPVSDASVPVVANEVTVGIEPVVAMFVLVAVAVAMTCPPTVSR